MLLPAHLCLDTVPSCRAGVVERSELVGLAEAAAASGTAAAAAPPVAPNLTFSDLARLCQPVLQHALNSHRSPEQASSRRAGCWASLPSMLCMLYRAVQDSGMQARPPQPPIQLNRSRRVPC